MHRFGPNNDARVEIAIARINDVHFVSKILREECSDTLSSDSLDDIYQDEEKLAQMSIARKRDELKFQKKSNSKEIKISKQTNTR